MLMFHDGVGKASLFYMGLSQIIIFSFEYFPFVIVYFLIFLIMTTCISVLPAKGFGKAFRWGKVPALWPSWC